VKDLTERLRWYADEADAPREAYDLTKDAGERISTLEAMTDQLAQAAYATNTAHDSWCPGDDPSPLLRRVWPTGCPYCAALRAYEADKEAHR
jgi:hypothetical protein